MKNHFLVIFFFLLFCFAPFKSSATNLDVIINEIAWMGTTNSANDEWIELYNNTQNSINLDGWQLISQDGTPKINLSGTILANGFYLLERTDDNTVSAIIADQIYTGALENNGEYLKLYDGLGNLVDEINCDYGWFTGDNNTKQTIERTSSGWQNSENSGGTPKAENSTGTDMGQIPVETQQNPPVPIIVPIEVAPTSNSIEVLEKVEPPPIYPTRVIFNEILPSPEGPDEIEEWIEIYNENNFEVSLFNWSIKDAEGKSTIYAFPSNTKIGPKNYLVLTRPVTKITLNNTGDKLILLQPDGKIADTVIYEKSPQSQSYNRVNTNWLWSSTLTPGSANIVTDNTADDKQNNTATLKDTIKNEQLTASLSQIIARPKSFLFIFLIALGISIFSAIIFFFLKDKILKNNKKT